MSATLAPFGLRPVSMGFPGTPQVIAIPGCIASGYATSLFQNEPVYLNATGQLIGARDNTSSPSVPEAILLGSLQGVEYFDSTGKLVKTNFWLASTAILSGTVVTAFVTADPNQIYEVQAAGSIASGKIGDHYNFVPSGTAYDATDGSTTTGMSLAAVNATAVADGSLGQVICVGFNNEPGNAAGDTYTIIRCKLAAPQWGGTCPVKTA